MAEFAVFRSVYIIGGYFIIQGKKTTILREIHFLLLEMRRPLGGILRCGGYPRTPFSKGKKTDGRAMHRPFFFYWNCDAGLSPSAGFLLLEIYIRPSAGFLLLVYGGDTGVTLVSPIF